MLPRLESFKNDGADHSANWKSRIAYQSLFDPSQGRNEQKNKLGVARKRKVTSRKVT